MLADRAHFDHIAPRYAGIRGGLDPIYAAARPRLTELAAGRDVLDVGGGGVLPFDPGAAASLTALDLSAAMLALLPETGVTKRLGDARRMEDLGDGAFDLVLFNLSLHHIAGGGADALAQAWRVLRPGGELVLHEPVLRPALAWLGAPLSAFSELLGAGPARLRGGAQLAAFVAAAVGQPSPAVRRERLRPRGWADPLGGTFPGWVRLPLSWHPTIFELFFLAKPRG